MVWLVISKDVSVIVRRESKVVASEDGWEVAGV